MQFCEPTCSIFLFMYVINEGPLTKKASFPNWACRLYPISEITWFRFQCSRKSIEKLKICSVFCSLILKFPGHGMKQKVPKIWAKIPCSGKDQKSLVFVLKTTYFEQTKSKNKFCEKIQDWNCLLDPVTKTKVFRKSF